jgi:hypothetical protein
MGRTDGHVTAKRDSGFPAAPGVPPPTRVLLPRAGGKARVGAGDEIVKVAEGPERFTVADIDSGNV